MFIPHFLRGLGFPLHPFIRGLMFYYGLDFHDLAPNSFLHTSAFIVLCETLLRIPPHFSLWRKVFQSEAEGGRRMWHPSLKQPIYHALLAQRPCLLAHTTSWYRKEPLY